jgi:hypothetical protein
LWKGAGFLFLSPVDSGPIAANEQLEIPLIRSIVIKPMDNDKPKEGA